MLLNVDVCSRGSTEQLVDVPRDDGVCVKEYDDIRDIVHAPGLQLSENVLIPFVSVTVRVGNR